MNSVPWLNEFLTLAVVHLLAVAAPGPDFAVTVRQCLRFGRKAGIGVALGIGAGMSVHVVYTLLGVSAILHATPWLMGLAEVLGGGYLLYLAISFIRQSMRAQPTDPALQESGTGGAAVMSFRKSFAIGFIANVLNPKASLFFLAVFTTLISPATPLTVQIFYGAWICLINAVWFVFVSVVFTRSQVRQVFLRAGRWVDLAVGSLLGAFSLRLFWGVLNRQP